MITGTASRPLGFNANSVVTVGTFDGVHLGHRSILRELMRRSAALSARSIVITFDRHPREVLGKGPVDLLTPLEDRLALIEAAGADAALVLEFTYEFSRQTPRDFFEKTVIRGTGASEVIVGYDHMFGRDREAGIRELRALGDEYRFGVTVVDPVTVGGELVKSSRIRELLLRGDAAHAEKLLGRPYGFRGMVIAGDRRGASLGFPTANIAAGDSRQLVPAGGVYCVQVSFDGRRTGGMLNIGVRPTFADSGTRTIEVNIFDFSGDLYGKTITVEFLKRIRDEKRFSSAKLLIEQLRRDRDECLQYLASSVMANSGKEF